MDEQNITSHVQLNDLVKRAGNNLILIHFFAGWCTSCTNIAPKVDAIAGDIDNFTILKVNVEQCPGIVEAYEITQLPTFVFVKNKLILRTLRGNEYNVLKETAINIAKKHSVQK
ncbi:thioredoxin-2-like [Cimex lectularius]|uniref:Thioredoxin domain-containing protein n=1 Tax=Cimex lectularius TaxID=79782 RepID=A0A8I6R8U5_CIMLE|nr:thioredoxin-2-like [Cimex lectularius]